MSQPDVAARDRSERIADVLEQAGRGDRAAFAQLYDDVAPTLFGVVLRLARRRDVAEDIFQDVMVKVWTKASLFDRTKGGALPWLVTLARNTVFDRLAAMKHEPASLDEPVIAEAVARLATATSADPILRATLLRCIAELKETYRDCLLLAYLYGLEYRELSERMSVPANTIKVRVFRAAAQVRKCIDA